MRRKALSLVLGLCMVIGLMTSAYAAAPSATGDETPDTTVTAVTPAPVTPAAPEVPTATVSAPAATASDGTVIPVDDIKVAAVTAVSELPAEEAAVLTAATEALTSAASTAEFVESTGAEVVAAVEAVLAEANKALPADAQLSMEDLTPAAMFSVSSAGAAAKVIEEGGSVELSFEVEGISDGDVVVVLVFDGQNWTSVPAVVKNGKVVGTFTTLGTVVIMKADQAANDSRVTSPQTSGANLEGVMVCGVVLSLAVMALCFKRRRMA